MGVWKDWNQQQVAVAGNAETSRSEVSVLSHQQVHCAKRMWTCIRTTWEAHVGNAQGEQVDREVLLVAICLYDCLCAGAGGTLSWYLMFCR